MVVWVVLLAAVCGIEVDLDAQGRSSLARNHKHHGGADRREPAADTPRRASGPQLVDLDADTSNSAWAARYARLQQQAEDMAYLQGESQRVGHAYRSAHDPSEGHARALHAKYYDLRDELRSKRRDIARHTSDLITAIEPVSSAEAAVRERLGSFLEQLRPSRLGAAIRHRRQSLVQDGEAASPDAPPAYAPQEGDGDGDTDGGSGDDGESEGPPDEEAEAEVRKPAAGVDRAPRMVLDRSDPRGDRDTISQTAATEEMNEDRYEINKLQPKHHELLRDALGEYRTTRCEARSDCGGCENDDGNKYHCRNPDDNTCTPWKEGGDPRKCDEDNGYYKCDGPMIDRGTKPVAAVEVTPGGERLTIVIQGWDFVKNANPMEGTCLMGTLLPRKRLVEIMGDPGHKLESACSKKALEKNLELHLARCLTDTVEDADAPRDETRCEMASLLPPEINAPRAGGRRGTMSAHFQLYPGSVVQPNDVDVHYIMCLIRGPTLEDASTGFAFVAGGTHDPICVRKTAEGGMEKLVPCTNDDAAAPPGSGAAVPAIAMAALLAGYF